MTAVAHQPIANETSTDDLLRETVATQFDPRWGSPFWLNRAAQRGVDGLHDLRSLEDLRVLGTLTPRDIASCPLDMFIPRSVASDLSRYLFAQTGGTTGRGTWTLYQTERFQEAFVAPFVAAARAAGFPMGERWLYVGPSGPHIIGRAARAIARAVGSPEPFCIDFDPRWARRIGGSAFARERYIAHLIEQCVGVLEVTPVGVLFVTPPLGLSLADAMSAVQREAVRGLHYGGMRLTAEVRDELGERFPNAIHLSGYGNTLLGCAPELCVSPGRGPAYFPYGQRMQYALHDTAGRPVANGEIGRVSATRLDPDFFLCNLLERDEATRITLPAGAPIGFYQDGLLDPHPLERERLPVASGLY